MTTDADDIFERLLPMLAPILAGYGSSIDRQQAAELALRCAAVGIAVGSQMVSSNIEAGIFLSKMKAPL